MQASVEIFLLDLNRTLILDSDCLSIWTQDSWNHLQRGYFIHKVNNETIYLHKRIFGDCPSGLLVDHINGNPYDNRRANLRLATKSENSYNSKKQFGTKSKYKGAYKTPTGHTWFSRLGKIYLGCFHSEEEAAKAYDREIKRTNNKFARLNFPDATDAFLAEARIIGVAKRTNTSSKFLGVRKHKNKYLAQTTFNGRSIYIGSFDSEEDAARAYDDYMRKRECKNVRFNFPLSEEAGIFNSNINNP